VIDESLETPDKVRELQIKLYRKAKSEADFRFYQLYDKVYREDILRHAWAQAKANDGAPGVDQESFEDIESKGLEEWLDRLGRELHDKTYQPQPVRRVMIPKPGGGERPLGIPTIRDRVVQTAAKLILEPIFEADFEPNAYGYRPKKSAQDAIQEVDKLLYHGYTDALAHVPCRGRRSVEILGHHPALPADAMRGEEDRRQAHAATDSDVAESAGRRTG
jgi:RNA-directed DNA polymerase